MTPFLDQLYRFWLGMLSHLWQTTLVLIPLFILDRGIRNAPARVSHILWSVGLVKLMLPLALFGAFARSVGTALIPAVTGAPPAGGLATLQAVAAILDPSGALGLRTARIGSWQTWCVVIATAGWAAVAVWHVVRTLRDIGLARRHGGEPVDTLPPHLRNKFLTALRSSGVLREAVAICPAAAGPAVVGLARPRILIPGNLITALGEDELTAVLLHEDAHRRRREPLRLALQRLCSAPFFFYPLLRPIVRRLRETAELACDDWVRGSGVTLSTYARALARSVTLGLAPVGLSTAACSDRSFVSERLRRFAASGGYTMNARHRFVIATVVLLVGAGSFLPVPIQAGTAEGSSPATHAEKATSDDPKRDVDSMPVPVTTVQPTYPEGARKAGVQGTVLLGVKIDRSGNVESASVTEGVKGHPELGEAALEAVKQWRFEPATEDGEPVGIEVAIPVKFKLSDDKGARKEEKN